MRARKTTTALKKENFVKILHHERTLHSLELPPESPPLPFGSPRSVLFESYRRKSWRVHANQPRRQSIIHTRVRPSTLSVPNQAEKIPPTPPRTPPPLLSAIPCPLTLEQTPNPHCPPTRMALIGMNTSFTA
mmetsp:Transcript_33809/g.66947  ORF Transcript_33809/g.66947 Transcript_33809/m.66947 type:complete len:132 (-) Transcript_33809:367-762(-)